MFLDNGNLPYCKIAYGVISNTSTNTHAFMTHGHQCMKIGLL